MFVNIIYFVYKWTYDDASIFFLSVGRCVCIFIRQISTATVKEFYFTLQTFQKISMTFQRIVVKMKREKIINVTETRECKPILCNKGQYESIFNIHYNLMSFSMEETWTIRIPSTAFENS